MAILRDGTVRDETRLKAIVFCCLFKALKVVFVCCILVHAKTGGVRGLGVARAKPQNKHLSGVTVFIYSSYFITVIASLVP